MKANDFVTLSNAAFDAAYRIADGYAEFLAVRIAENDILFLLLMLTNSSRNRSDIYNSGLLLEVRDALLD